MSDVIKTRREAGILEVTLDRPKANAIDLATSRLMGETFRAFRDDPELRVAIVRTAGDKFFSAGWDLKAAAAGDDTNYGPGGFAGLTELFDLDKPVIAAVNGLCAGGGFELALAADLIVAAAHAEFLLPEIRVGIIPDSGGVLRLPQRLPRAVALEMMMMGSRLAAADALRFGLVNRVVAQADLLATARALAADLAGMAPLALRAIKAVVNATEAVSVADGFALMRGGAIPIYQHMLASDDAREGPRAFAEKRAPNWRNR
jgi:crotonobetainyl-CoA hydratase